MRELSIVIGLVAGGLAVIALSVFAGNDRDLFVPPPDAVAEGFTRQVAEGRYELALKYVSDELRQDRGAELLRQRFEPMRRNLGAIDTVTSELQALEPSSAAARTTISAKRGSAVLELRFIRERRLWVVSELP